MRSPDGKALGAAIAASRPMTNPSHSIAFRSAGNCFNDRAFAPSPRTKAWQRNHHKGTKELRRTPCLNLCDGPHRPTTIADRDRKGNRAGRNPDPEPALAHRAAQA